MNKIALGLIASICITGCATKKHEPVKYAKTATFVQMAPLYKSDFVRLGSADETVLWVGNHYPDSTYLWDVVVINEQYFYADKVIPTSPVFNHFVSNKTEETEDKKTPIYKEMVKRVFFAFASEKLSAEGRSTLSKLPLKEATEVVIEAHTDAIGSSKYNIELSKKRALTVKNELIRLGYNASSIKMSYHGKERPEAPNDSDDGRAKNRRAVIVLKVPDVATTEEERVEEMLKEAKTKLNQPAMQNTERDEGEAGFVGSIRVEEASDDELRALMSDEDRMGTIESEGLNELETENETDQDS